MKVIAKIELSDYYCLKQLGNNNTESPEQVQDQLRSQKKISQSLLLLLLLPYHA